MAKVKNYINNKTFYESIVSYKAELREAEISGNVKPIIPKYIGECLFMICSKLIKKGNFSGYSKHWKDEMVSDALIDCISSVDNFKPEKTDNPFAYFTMIAWNAFIRRITKEKKQTYIKHKNYENSFLMNELWEGDSSAQMIRNEYSEEIVAAFEKKLNVTKKSNKPIGLEKFVEEENEERASSPN